MALAHDGHDRDVVELGVVQAVEQVDGTRARRGHADADPAGELRVSHRLEGGHLLVPGLDELRVVLGPAPRGQDAVDPVTRIGEHVAHVPGAQPFEQKISNRRCHDHPSAVSTQTSRADQQTAGTLDSSALPPPMASNPPISPLTSAAAMSFCNRATVAAKLLLDGVSG
jgi:hypothetical protein